MAEGVQVLVSLDGRWRVDIRPDGRAEVRQDGFLLATVREPELRAALARLGVVPTSRDGCYGV